MKNPTFMNRSGIQKRGLGAALVLLFSLFSAVSLLGQSIASTNPNSTTAGQSITMVITGNNTNFTTVTGMYLRSNSNGTIYQPVNYAINSATNISANFTIPPNAPLGTYRFECYGHAAAFINALTVSVGPGSAYGQVSGKVIIDNNSNCLEDGGDASATNTIVTLTPGPYYITTGPQGDYSAWIPNGTYTATVNTNPLGYGAWSCASSHPVNILTSLSTDGGNDFYWHYLPYSDQSVDFYLPWYRPGFSQTAYIYFYNNGTTAINNAIGTVVANIPFAATVSPAPTSVVGNTYTFNFGTVAANSYRSVSFSSTVPVLTPFGTQIGFTASYPAVGSDPFPNNNMGSRSAVVTGSFDPNDKRVWDPSGNPADGPVDPSITRLDYMIRFQNTGNDTAFNIVIKDTLSAFLNAGTLRITSSSHPCQLSVSGSNRAQFTFPNILLVDSVHNEPLSHGYVNYSIDLNPGVPVGTNIQNRASIYFDFNAPILTNRTNTVLCALLPANFSATSVGPNFSFTNLSGGSATSWTWDFGDGGTSTLQNPTHTYGGSGPYVVCLTVSNGCRSTTFCDTFLTCQPPLPAFASGVTGATAAFTNQSHPSVTTWAWTFGDGGTSTLANPTHTYANNGTYNVCLTTTNGCTTQSICQSVTICRALNQAFSEVLSAQTATFQDLSDASVTSWAWTFGDGGTSTLQNPTHVYATGGTYNVCLTVTSSCTTATTCHNVIVTCPAISGNFSSTTTGLSSNFSDLSTGAITAWAWTFGDGGTSTLQNPTHAYTAPGTYNVCLTITSSCTTATTCQSVTICNALNQAFGSAISGYSVAFTDQSDPSATTWAWTFGDGGTSTLQNPTHTYAAGAAYNVCLTVSNPCYTASTCSQVDLCQATNESINYVMGPVLNVDFTGTADPSVNVWNWTFGDGGTSTLQNPTHTYASAGSYQVCLQVANACSSSVACTNIGLVGMDDLKAASFQVFPNPSAAIFKLEADLPSAGILHMRIYDAKGVQVYAGERAAAAGPMQEVLDLSAQSAGLYLLQLEHEGLRYAIRLQKL